MKRLFQLQPSRGDLLRTAVVIVFAILLLYTGYMQIFDKSYGGLARTNYLRYEPIYPPRGEVFDRNGEYLVQNKGCYDLMVVYRELPREGFDTVRLCEVSGLTRNGLEKELANARLRGRERCKVASYLTVEDKVRLDEMNIPGFSTVLRTVRHYPRKIGGNLLGSLGEVSDKQLKRHPEYAVGDYVGTEGIEAAYEWALRGEKGYAWCYKFASGGQRDSVVVPAVAGRSIVCTIDGALQQFAEELLAGKVGAVVAIEPSTGEILVMASSPTFDPEELVGRERGNNYMKELGNPRRPLFNRAVQSRYPPGSTFKLVNGLIGMQEGVLTPANAYPCNKGYHFGRVRVGCHVHGSPLALRDAIATSCNSYFCYVFRNILENRRYGSTKEAYERWYEYVVEDFGFGRRLGSDFTGEGRGFVPTREFFDKFYKGRWNSLTVLSLSIGQGELGCTPLQMANMVAAVANRGYYIVPHIVRTIGSDSLDEQYRRRHTIRIDRKHFETVIDGMWYGVNVAGTGRSACLPGLDVCGKTGTAQNPNGADHSTFVSFAPRNNPRIAIAVYVEHGGFGNEIAAPIASLIEEMYLTGKVERQELVDYVRNKHISYPKYDRKRK